MFGRPIPPPEFPRRKDSFSAALSTTPEGRRLSFAGEVSLTNEKWRYPNPSSSEPSVKVYASQRDRSFARPYFDRDSAHARMHPRGGLWIGWHCASDLCTSAARSTVLSHQISAVFVAAIDYGLCSTQLERLCCSRIVEDRRFRNDGVNGVLGGEAARPHSSLY